MRLLLILQSSFWSNFTSIRTPLALAGAFAAIFFLIVRRMLKHFTPRNPDQRSGFKLARLILILLFILSLVAMCLGFVGYMIPPKQSDGDDLSAAEREALRLEDEVMKVEGAWEGMDSSPAYRQTVFQTAPKLADQLLTINDNDLRPAYKVLKYEYALYAHAMSASVQPANTTSEKEAKIQYATKGLDSGRTAMYLIDDVRRKYTTNEGYKQAMNYINSNEVEDRVNYLSAICLCRKADVLNDPSLRQQARESIAKISQPHLANFPTERNVEFKGCLDNAGGAK